jgi:hypothetical protein
MGWRGLDSGPDSLQDAGLIGAAGSHLWFSDGDGLLAVSSDAKQRTAYSNQQIGLSKKDWVTGVVSAGERTWFATTRAILEFDGSRWRELPMPSGAPEHLHGVAAGADGMLWVTGGGAGRTFRYVLYLVAFVPLAIMAGIAWLVWLSRSRQRQQHRRVAEAVQHAT